MRLSKEYTTDFVRSKDGTKIHYRQIGTGAGLILVHGGMMYSQNFMELAKFLANDFTVYIPDRSGRGLSDQHDKYSLVAESEDIQAIINKTGTENAFGLSSGAIIVLQTAILNPTLKKIALFEPPILLDNTAPASWITDYKLAMSKNNFGKAFISILKGTSDSSLMKTLPSFITAPLMNIAIKAEANKILKEDEIPLKSLVAAMHYDIKIINESHGVIDKCKVLTSEILLLGGKKSQDFLKDSLDALSSALPKAKRISFADLGHVAPDNSGNPKIVAQELQRFFETTDNKADHN